MEIPPFHSEQPTLAAAVRVGSRAVNAALAELKRRLAGRYLISDPRVLLALAMAALREKLH